MKICYLANTAVPSTTASAIQIIKMCESFSKLKHKVLLITSNASDKKVFNFYGVKVKFQIRKLKKYNKFPLGLKYYLFSLSSIIESLNFKPDIYITRNFFTSFLLTILGKKNILELHHGIEIEGRIVRFIVKNLNFFNYKSLLMLVAITNSVKNYYQKKFLINTNKIIVAPSGTSIENKFFNNISKNKKRLNIGYFGSLYKSRGVDLILKLSRMDRENKYFIFGNLKNYKNIKNKYHQHNLHLNDYLPYKSVPKNILKMDVLLMPYQEKIVAAGNIGNIIDFTSPLKLFDYIACGKIIISSQVQVLEEILKEKKNVIFIKNFNNVYAWKNEIQKIKFLNDKRFIISQNNFKLSKNYKLKERAQRILDSLNYDFEKN
jgi:glycosyltransferase involved in cell wall biosynthesis